MVFYASIVCALLFGMPHRAISRPVSYPGGWTIMQKNNVNHSLHIHYSPTAYYSIGYIGMYSRTMPSWQGAQLNYLVKRWNTRHSQANIYLKSGLGVMAQRNPRVSGFSGIAVDWETRRYFASYDNRLDTIGATLHVEHDTRLGIAPYLGSYGDWHTWLMVTVHYDSHAPPKLTPLIRVFKSGYLLECGLTPDGDVLVNSIIRL